MDVQSAWKHQLGRMVSLCMQEATEYERGRTLQVLQPSLAGLLQPEQQPVAPTAALQLGRPSLPPVASSTQAKPAAGSSISNTPADGQGQTVTSIKQEDLEAANVSHQTPAPRSKADMPAAFLTPITGPGVLKTAALPMQTPIASSAATPSFMAGGLSSQQMASMVRLPQQQQTAANLLPPAAALAGTPQQFQVALPGVSGIEATASFAPTLLVPAVNTPLMQQVLLQQRLQQQQLPRQASTPGSANKDAIITTTQPNARKGKRRGYCIQPEALKRLVAQQMQKKQQHEGDQLEQQSDGQEKDQHEIATGLQSQQLSTRFHPQQQQQRSIPRVLQDAGFATEESPGSTVVGLLPLQLPVLDSPNSLGLRMTCAEELEQPGVQLELDASKLFGSAQKRLRLSICDEAHGSAAPLMHQQSDLQQALISPVAVPAAAVRGAVAGASAATGVPAAAAASPAFGPPSLMTPSKFFASSPTSGAAAGGAGVTLPQPAFATPSKFFDGSPLSADKQALPAQTTPETPLLLGVPKRLDMDAQAATMAAGTSSSSGILRNSTAAASGGNAQTGSKAGAAAAAGQMSSWVPVGGVTRLSGVSAAVDPAAVAATPAGAAIKVGLLCTPMAGVVVKEEVIDDAAAAAAAPVDCLPVKAAGAAAGGGGSIGATDVTAAGVGLCTPAGVMQQVQLTPVT